MASLNDSDTYNILIKSTADNKGFTQASESADKLSESTEKTSKFAGLASVAHNAFGVAAGLALNQAAFAAVDFAKSTIASFEESQNQIAQTNAVLKSTAGVAGVTAQEVDKLSKTWEHQTTYSDEAVRSAENMLLTFTNIHSNVFPQTTQAVLDMSTAMHQDLQTTSIQVGKALQDPVQGVTALQRVGVRLTESQKDLVKQMVATGDTAGAQKLILKELQTEFGGSAEAAGKTFAGSMAILKNKFDDFKESVGGYVAEHGVAFLDNMGQIFNEVKHVAEQIYTFLQPSINALSKEVEQFLPTAKILWQDVLKPLAEVLGVAIVLSVWAVINVLNIVLHVIQDLVQWVRNVSGAFGNAWGAIVNTWQAAVGFFSGIAGGIKGTFTGIASGITSPFKTAFNAIADLWNNTVGKLNFTIPSWVPSIGGKGWDVPDIPHFASGVTNFSGGVALVGENGPEIVSLPKGSNVFSNGTSKKSIGGTTIHQVNHIYNQLDLDLANRELGWRLANV